MSKFIDTRNLQKNDKTRMSHCVRETRIPRSQLCHKKVNLKGKPESLELTYIEKSANWLQCLALHIMKQCTKFREDPNCSSREISENVKCDGQTDGRTDRKTKYPATKLAGIKSRREISRNK